MCTKLFIRFIVVSAGITEKMQRFIQDWQVWPLWSGDLSEPSL